MFSIATSQGHGRAGHTELLFSTAVASTT